MDHTQDRPEILVEGLSFGEGPRWHDHRLWYSDFYRRLVSSVGMEGDVQIEVALDDDRPSGLGWLPDGRLLVVAMDSRRVLRREVDGRLVEHGDIGPWAGGPANDMAVSSTGQAYVGNFGFTIGTPRSTASLVRIDRDGTAHEVATELAFPNGAVFTPGDDVLIVAESIAARLTAFDVAPDGSLPSRRLWADLGPAGLRNPDGICLDATGRIWVANAGSSVCSLVEEGGTVVDEVVASQPCFACALGGPDGRSLFLVTAPSFGDDLDGTSDGRIEVAPVDVPAAGFV